MKNKDTRGGARTGAGRPSLFPEKGKKKITLSLLDEAIEKLDVLSKDSGISRSDYISKMIIDIK